MARLVKAWPPIVSALLLLAAFPPFELGLVVFAALVPWLLSLRETSARGAFRSGYVFGLVYMIGQMHWVGVLAERWTGNPMLGFIPWILCGLVGALYFGLTGVLLRQCWKLGAPWLIPIVWAGIEVFRSYIPGLAFPYGLIANPLWLFPPLIQNAYFGSIYLVSAWVLLVNVMIALIMSGDGFMKVRQYAMGIALFLVVSLIRLGSPVGGDPHTILVGQPGLDYAFGDEATNSAKLRTIVHGMYEQARAKHAELIVLPEGISSDTGFPPHPPFEVEASPPIIFGGKRGNDPMYQTAFAHDAGHWQFADKTRLVIFGEYVPFRKYIPFFDDTFHLPTGDMSPGEHVLALDVGGIKLGPVICFEGVFPDIAYRQARNGAQLLTVMSVDDWYMGTGAPGQLRAASVWRAVETGLPLVRAATLGYSMAIDAHGNVLAEAPIGETRALAITLTLPRNPRPFPLWPVFPMLVLLSLPVVPLLYRRARAEPAQSG